MASTPTTVAPAVHTALEQQLLNTSGKVSLAERFRALFSLKALKDRKSIDIISQGFLDTSALLKHELAYVLGQMGDPYALPVLEQVLRNDQEDPMVRHEAAEAMGAIGDPQSLPILETYRTYPQPDIAQTCELAVERIRYQTAQAKAASSGTTKDPAANGGYTSVDPAPPTDDSSQTAASLRQTLLDTTRPLFARYRAMFALRNRGDEESVLALAQGLDDESALFRHEIAFVFGQMQHPASVPALTKALANEQEQAMVRHECAEALGSIATPAVLETLEEFSTDSEQVVRESCIVALDMYRHEQSGEFQYATIPDAN